MLWSVILFLALHSFIFTFIVVIIIPYLFDQTVERPWGKTLDIFFLKKINKGNPRLRRGEVR